jgi:glucosylceramidase
MGPHNQGCGTCTGFITVHNGDVRTGQVDYTVEYYTMGHLTKFVKPGAFRIDSNDNASVRKRGVEESGRVEGTHRLQLDR